MISCVMRVAGDWASPRNLCLVMWVLLIWLTGVDAPSVHNQGAASSLRSFPQQLRSPRRIGEGVDSVYAARQRIAAVWQPVMLLQ
jgi:hypothetical protein